MGTCPKSSNAIISKIPAEAEAAATKVSELTQAEQRAEAEAILVKLNWSPVQAKAIISAIPHLPPWWDQSDWRFGLMFDWASSTNHQDPTALKTQLGFLTDDLRNAFQTIGAAISAAKTEEEATKAFRPYADKLAA